MKIREIEIRNKTEKWTQKQNRNTNSETKPKNEIRNKIEKMKYQNLKPRNKKKRSLENTNTEIERGRKSSTKRESFQCQCRRLLSEIAEDRTLVIAFFLVAGAKIRWSKT